MALAPNKKTLYVVNEIDCHHGLPVGTIDTFSISRNGLLTRLGHRELALSATMPRHAAVSQDGQCLVVAASGGGAYNVLPIGEDGDLKRISAAWKETGISRDTESSMAKPQMVAFDPRGRVIALDAGMNNLSVFHVSGDEMRVHTRTDLRRGTQATRIAMHPAGTAIYTLHQDELTWHEYDPVNGTVADRGQHIPYAGAGESLSVHPTGEYVYVGHREGGVGVFAVNRSNGALEFGTIEGADLGELRALDIAPSGMTMVGITATGQLLEATIDSTGGRLRAVSRRERAKAPTCMAVLYHQA
jgi:6-phosphogluconolactonase